MTGQIQPRSAAPLARPITPTASLATVQPAMTPREIWSILRQRLRLIVVCSIAGLLIGGILYFLQNRSSPRFTTVAQIQVLPQEEKDPTTIGDQSLNKDTQFQFRNTIASQLKNRSNWLGTFIENLNSADPASAEDFPVAWYKEMQKQKWLAPSDIIVKADRYFDKYLRISVDREANIIQLSLSCFGSSQKDDGARILRRIAGIFQSMRENEAQSKWSGYLGNLEKNRKKIQDDLDNGPLKKLKDIRSTFAIGNLSGINFRDFIEEKMADLEAQSSALESEKARLASDVSFLKSRAESDYDAVVREQIEQDPVAAQMRQRLTELEVLLATQMASFGENHRRVKELRDARDQARKDLEDRQKQIGDIVRQSQYILNRENLDSKTAELKAREVQLDAAKKQHGEVRNARAEYELAESKREELQKQFESYDTQIKKIETLVTSPDRTKIQFNPKQIVPPLEKDWPRWYIHIPGGFILGLMVGLGIAFLLEFSNQLLRTPRDVMRHVSAPLLGMICHEQDDAETEGVDLLQVVRQAPYSFMSDNYRQFRTNLRLSASAANKKILLVTSPTAGDGKTTVVMNLSSTFVAEGKKVLVIDTNFRRPSVAANLPRPAQGQSDAHADFGLSNYLLGQCSDPREIIRRSGTEGLDVIDSGPIPPNPAEVLGSPAMKKLLDTVRESYDYVLLDGPALLVSDAKTLAALVEGTLVVFNAKRTHRGEAQRTLRELREIQATVVGTVLLGVENLKGGYFGQLYKNFQDYNKKDNPIVKPVN